MGGGCSSGVVGARIYEVHLGSFGIPVRGRVLDDAKGVDPEVLEIELARDGNGVLYCQRQCFVREPFSSELTVGFGGKG